MAAWKEAGSGIGGELSLNRAPVQEALIGGQGFPGNHDPLAPHLQSLHSRNPEGCLYGPCPTRAFVQMRRRPPSPPTREMHSHGKQLEKKVTLRFQPCPFSQCLCAKQHAQPYMVALSLTHPCPPINGHQWAHPHTRL